MSKFFLTVVQFLLVSSIFSATGGESDTSGSNVWHDVTISEISYFAATTFGGYHKPGQFQLVTDIPGTYILTSPGDLTEADSDINILYSTLLLAFMNNKKVTLVIAKSQFQSDRPYVRAVGIIK